MIKIAPSILSADFTQLGRSLDSVKNADLIHFDVMDGAFVPSISFGMPVIKSLRPVTDFLSRARSARSTPVSKTRAASARTSRKMRRGSSLSPDSSRSAMPLMRS